MKRIAVAAALVALTLTSCAAKFGGSVGTVALTMPTAGNAATSCLLPAVLWPVATGTPAVAHLRITQGAWAWEDSTASAYGAVAQFVPPLLPGTALATLEGWASDADSAGCRITITRTPSTVAKPPGKPALSVAP
jgi:hypothetical protein